MGVNNSKQNEDISDIGNAVKLLNDLILNGKEEFLKEISEVNQNEDGLAMNAINAVIEVGENLSRVGVKEHQKRDLFNIQMIVKALSGVKNEQGQGVLDVVNDENREILGRFFEVGYTEYKDGPVVSANLGRANGLLERHDLFAKL